MGEFSLKRPEDEEEKLRAYIASLMPGEEKSAMEAAMADIGGLPFGPERDAALKQLTTDYEGRESSLRDDLTLAFDQFNTPTAEGDTGPSGNPYAVTIAANPLEHVAVGWQKYQGGKGIKEAKASREALSQSKELGLQRYQASLLKDEERKKKGSFLPSWFTGN